MKRARWALILMSYGLSIIGGTLTWLCPGLIGLAVAMVFLAGFLVASAYGFNIPKAMSKRWPEYYPPEQE